MHFGVVLTWGEVFTVCYIFWVHFEEDSAVGHFLKVLVASSLF